MYTGARAARHVCWAREERDLGGAGSEIEIAAAGAPLPGYLARPARGHGPGVLVLHEAFGLVEHVREVCDRLARHDFVALAPDLYRGETADSIEEARRLAAGLEPGRLGDDLEAAVQGLLNQTSVDGGRVGVVGFCMGGHLALMAAARSPRVAAAVDFYGALPGLPLAADRIQAAVLGIFGERDEFIPPDRVESLRQELERAGVRHSLQLQPGAGHGFMNDSRPDRYDAVAAAAGWDLMLAFLRAELA